MTRFLGFLTAAAVALTMSAGLSAQGAMKTLKAQGTVSAVTVDSVTVKGADGEWKFMVDKDTQVTAKGATHKTLALKADGKTPILTDFVKAGDRVNVAYHDMGTMKHASALAVTLAAPPAK